MSNDRDWFKHEPQDNAGLQFASKHGTPMERLLNYRPKSTEELAEWVLMASSNLKDQDEKRLLTPLTPFMAYQIARMMQMANLKVPK